MIRTAWNNGEHHKSGAAYGLKLGITDRDRHFNRAWQTVLIELPSQCGLITAEAIVAKKSVWGPQTRSANPGCGVRGVPYNPAPGSGGGRKAYKT